MIFVKWFLSWWIPVWKFIVSVVKEVLAPVTDYMDHLDGYKISGFGAFGVAAVIAWKLVDIIQKAIETMVAHPEVAPSISGIITGVAALTVLVTAFLGVGYWMFGHAKDVDKSLVSSNPQGDQGGVNPPLQ